jgi:hypothetical protein
LEKMSRAFAVTIGAARPPASEDNLLADGTRRKIAVPQWNGLSGGNDHRRPPASMLRSAMWPNRARLTPARNAPRVTYGRISGITAILITWENIVEIKESFAAKPGTHKPSIAPAPCQQPFATEGKFSSQLEYSFFPRMISILASVASMM